MYIMRSYRKPVWQTLALGAIAGVRASIAPAIVGHYVSGGAYSAISFPGMRFLRSPVTSMATRLFSAAENESQPIDPDKNTLQLADIAMNIASGAFVGATIFKKNKQSMLEGMLIGGTAALVTSVATFYLRKHADKLPDVTHQLTGAFQDAFAYSCGVALVKK
jgi:uncharacterized membrane protein